MANRELVQLSKTYKEQNLSGMLMSSKLDGFRMVSDGGVSRGVPKSQVPWANNVGDSRYKIPPIATGLWTRYGNVVHAPDWFLDGLPKGIVLDGEGWSPYLSRQSIRSICAKIVPDPLEWAKVGFWVFNRLSPHTWLEEGRISNPNYNKIITSDSIDFFYERGGASFSKNTNLQVATWLRTNIHNCGDHVHAVEQTQLPWDAAEAKIALSERLMAEMSRPNGEGLILLDPISFTEMKRSGSSLKVKPRDDSEGTVVGYISANAGKIQGKLGALVIDWKGIRLELSGFTDAERELSESSWAWNNLGQQLPEDITCPKFPRGSQVTFSYRGLTDDGVPNEAVYFRGRD